MINTARRGIVVGVVALLALPTSGSAQPARLVRTASVPVTGQVQPLAGYQRLGLDPAQASLHRRLDRFAAQGVSVGLLNSSLAAEQATEPAAESGSGQPAAFDDLVDLGNLDGRGLAEIGEERRTASSSGQALQLVVRDALTGRPLWTRTDRITGKKVIFAFGAPVGRAGRPGVLVWVDDLQRGTATVTALDGRGRQLWRSSVVPPKAVAPPTAPVVGVSGGAQYFYGWLVAVAQLRAGPPELVLMSESSQSEHTELMESQTGAVAFSATSLADGRSRPLPGGTSSTSGMVFGDVLDDVTGDGFDDLLVADGGQHTVRVLRAFDGATAWSRDDAFTGDLLGANGVPGVLQERAGGHVAEDVVLVSRPTVSPLSVVAGDPKPSLSLLGGHSGHTAWTRPGEAGYLVGRTTGPALGVLQDESTTSDSTVTAKGVLTVYDAAGRARWTRSASVQRPTSGGGLGFAYAYAADDLDGDAASEGFLQLVAFTDSGESERAVFLRGRDGAVLPLPTSDFLGGGVRPGHHDLVSVLRSRTGLAVTVYDGVSRRSIFRSVLPHTVGLASGYAYADRLTGRACDDVLVAAAGGSRTAVAVLAPSGRLRWAVVRAGTASAVGAVLRPQQAPARAC